MDELIQLPGRMQGHLLRALESSLAVRNRGQFFLWTQGQLQALVPHGLMLCVVFDAEHQVVHFDCLQGVPLQAEVLQSLCDPEDGFNVRVARRCREQGLLSLHLDAGQPELAPTWADLANEWAGLELGHAMFLGTGPMAGGGSSFFGLLRLRGAPEPMHTLLLQVLLPQLHMALSRVQFHQGQGDITAAVALPQEDCELTERQLEILNWVKLGKTNFEISLILDISAQTVKNHLQKLFKRLNVHNRAQAVAMSMSLPAGSKARLP